MRILHTADWHVGRRLGRHDRAAETAAALEEVARITTEHEVDLVLVAGDVFDRPIPPVDALALGLQGLLRLTEGRPVVAVAGNHDSPELFDALAPLVRNQGRGVHLIGSIRRPDHGGVLGPEELGVPALVGCLPFLREGRVVDFMRDAGEWYGQYAERIAALCAAFDAALVARAGTELVPLLVAHFMVGGVKVGGSERELHVGGAYVASAQAIPPGPQYVALGHIHAPQAIPGSPVPGQYAGSLLPLDFGEAGEAKRVVIVDAEPGRLATVTSIPLVSGRSFAPKGRGIRSTRGSTSFATRTSTSPCAWAGSTRTWVGAPRIPSRSWSTSVRTGHPGSAAPAPADHARAMRSSTPTTTGGTRATSRPRTCSGCSARCSKRWPMRPRELTVQGFRSYRGRTTFDVRGGRLVGVVGPIGAGKSTILDAVE